MLLLWRFGLRLLLRGGMRGRPADDAARRRGLRVRRGFRLAFFFLLFLAFLRRGLLGAAAERFLARLAASIFAVAAFCAALRAFFRFFFFAMALPQDAQRDERDGGPFGPPRKPATGRTGEGRLRGRRHRE